MMRPGWKETSTHKGRRISSRQHNKRRAIVDYHAAHTQIEVVRLPALDAKSVIFQWDGPLSEEEAQKIADTFFSNQPKETRPIIPPSKLDVSLHTETTRTVRCELSSDDLEKILQQWARDNITNIDDAGEFRFDWHCYDKLPSVDVVWKKIVYTKSE